MQARVQGVPDLSRRERRKLEVRARIVESALALFREHGVAGAKVSEICESADVAHKTFFNHFPAKQDLVRQIAQHAIGELLIDIETARKEGVSTADRLMRFFTGMALRGLEAGPMFREVVSELVHVVHASSSRSDEARRLHDAFGAIVGDGLVAGDVTRRHDAETLTEMILGAYYVLIFNYANLDDFPLADQSAAVARFLADALAPNPAEAHVSRSIASRRARSATSSKE
jgi:AcrR family transcriptional regulator